jgi:hypothetical protein
MIRAFTKACTNVVMPFRYSAVQVTGSQSFMMPSEKTSGLTFSVVQQFSNNKDDKGKKEKEKPK